MKGLSATKLYETVRALIAVVKETEEWEDHDPMCQVSAFPRPKKAKCDCLYDPMHAAVKAVEAELRKGKK